MFKKWVKKLLIVALELLLISGAFWYLIEKRGLKSPYQTFQNITQQKIEKEEVRPSFPLKEGSVGKKYSWQYKGVKYELNQTLYESSYQFYKSLPKTFSYSGQLPSDWQEQYYGMFLKKVEGDDEIKNLANEIQTLGKKNKLTDDQIVELSLSFVQSIPYDDAKAKEILSKNGDVSMRYPYEVLYENLGVCSDKSILASMILRQMGYGTALFAYENENHMALGIECPKDSSTYGSGYCYAETTAVGHKIGIIPGLDQNSNKTVNLTELSTFENGSLQDSKQLSQATILQSSHGKLYRGVVATQKIIAEIAKLKEEINNTLPALSALKKTVADEEKELNDINKKLNLYQKEGNVEKFNALVEKYNDLLEIYKKDIKKYNSSVTIYNQTIARYNLLIKE